MGAEKHKIWVYGMVTDLKFHKAKVTAEGSYQKKPNEVDPPVVKSMLEHEWLEFIDDYKKSSGGSLMSYTETTLVTVNGNEFVGRADDFIMFCSQHYEFKDLRPEPLFEAMARMEYEELLASRKHDLVHFDIRVGEEEIGKMLIELYNDMVPTTCANFKQLCIGDRKSVIKNDPTPWHLKYENSVFHRVVKNGWIQGGDIIHGSGDDGWSIYGETFEDENYSVLHSKRGIVGMANKGRHSNSSQFYITFQPAPWMDCQYVAFGQVIEGLDTLAKMEALDTYNERPLNICKISNCGVVDIKKWVDSM